MESIISLAQCGLFLPKYNSSVLEVVKRSYTVRRARKEEVASLLNIEKASWKNLALTEAQVLRRINNHSTGQWVCEVDGMVVGVMYTQVIGSIDYLLQPNVNFNNQEDLHGLSKGNIVQLLGVAVLPEYAHLQIGLALRDFVVQLCYLDVDIFHVVAMTRCSSETIGSEKDYFAKALSGDDPTLKFHIGGGAKVLRVVENYRPADTVNFGHAVLIHYDLMKPNPSSSPTVVKQLTRQTFVTAEELQSLVLTALDAHAAARMNQLSSVEFLQTPFMDLGLSSLAMMEVRARLNVMIQSQSGSADLSTTVLFDHATPQRLLNHINCIPEADQSTIPRLGGIHSADPEEEMFAICSMSCRMPGGACTADDFHQALLDKLDAVQSIPKGWSWNARTRFAAFLSDAAAEGFDPAFFKLNIAEARQMDPHQRILLEVAHEALTASGTLSGLGHSTISPQVGVFVGLCNNEWKRDESVSLGPYDTTGSAQSAAANRISFLLGLEGPSIVVDTACSSSLAALHTALNALRCGDCDVALVAAADLLLSSHSLKVNIYYKNDSSDF